MASGDQEVFEDQIETNVEVLPRSTGRGRPTDWKNC
jgi:hypothetical protein